MEIQSSDFRLWGGRFREPISPELDALNRSLPIDYRLWEQDVRVCRAWVKALHRAAVLTSEELSVLLSGLDGVEEDVRESVPADAQDEDVHTLVERLLERRVGEVARKLRTGRSRNDQVATDLRLWAMDALTAVDLQARSLGRVLVERAATEIDIILPGYTHGQQAQPIRWSHCLLAHAWPLLRDCHRLQEAQRSSSVLPLGSGALAGSGIAVDREFLRSELGFARLSENSLDATGDRDFVAEALFALTMLGTHLSRLASEMIVFSSSEFGFIRLADAYSTGSSLMPQKRNPDVFELTRAKVGRLLGDLVALITVLKGIPQGYQKDLQEDKAILFGAIDDMLRVLPALAGTIATLEPQADRMQAALDEAIKATDVADCLVGAGVSFGRAHELVGQLVRLAEEADVPLCDVAPTEIDQLDPRLSQCVATVGDWETVIERRRIAGGTGREPVLAQVASLRIAFR